MPELPEVETVRRQLAKTLTGARLLAVTRVEPHMLADCSEDQLRAELPGRRLEEVSRLGKFLVVRLEGEAYLTLHLGMTGQLLLEWQSPDAYTRFGFELVDGVGKPLTLHFRDVRKFGRVSFTLGKPAPRLALLGPDAWVGEWDASYLARRLGRRTAPIKAVLLDQSLLAGIGNIYADETLWWTELSPLRPAAVLTEKEVDRLAGEIRRRLGEGVKLLGCSLSDFVDTQGKAGGFQEWLQAYGRKGRPCRRCGEVLARVVVAGRGTTFCPACQR